MLLKHLRGLLGSRLRFDFVKNTGIISLSAIIESAISYFVIVFISRYLGAGGLGRYSFAFAFVSIFFLFDDLGMSTVMVRDVSKNYALANKYLSAIQSTKLLLGLIAFAIYFISLFFIGKDELFTYLLIVGIWRFLAPLNGGFYILRIKHLAKQIAFLRILDKVVMLAGVVLSLLFSDMLKAILITYLVARVVTVSLTWLIARHHVSLKLTFDWPFIFSLLKKSYPFIFIGIFSMIYVKIDSVMLSFMQSDVIVGWYSSGYRLITLFNLFPSLLLTFGFPMLSRLIKKDKRSAKSAFEQLMYVALLIIIPICVGGLLYGGRVLEFIYHFDSLESVLAFKILIVAEIFIFLTTIMGYMISAADKQLTFAKVAGVGAALNLILNFILIPRYSLYGAAIATFATYALMFVLLFFFIRREVFTFSFIPPLLSVGGAAVIMGAVIWWLPQLHILLIIPIGAIIYALFLALFDRFTPNPLLLWKNVLPKSGK